MIDLSIYPAAAFTFYCFVVFFPCAVYGIRYTGYSNKFFTLFCNLKSSGSGFHIRTEVIDLVSFSPVTGRTDTIQVFV